MRRVLKRIAIVVVSLLVVVFLASFLLLRSNFAREKVRGMLLSTLNGMIDGEATIGSVRGGLLGDVTLIDVSIKDKEGRPFLKIDTLSSKYDLIEIWRRRIVLTDTRMVNPTIVLDRKSNEVWNYARIFKLGSDTAQRDTTGGLQLLRFDGAHLVNADITLRTPWEADSTLTAVERQRSVALALSDSGFLRIEPVDSTYQLVQQYYRLTAAIPSVRLIDPDESRMQIDIDSLRAVAKLFKATDIDVRQLSGEVEIGDDSLLFHNMDIQLPRSSLRTEGSYLLSGYDIRARIRADSVNGSDVHKFHHTIPEDIRGSFLLNLHVNNEQMRYEATEVKLASGNANADGDIDFTILPAGWRETILKTDLRIREVDTKLITRFLPTARLPRNGTFSGRLIANGPINAAQVNADLTLAEPLSGSSHVVARGGMGFAGEISFRNLAVRMSPFQLELIRHYAATFPMTGTVTGSANLNGVFGDTVRSTLDVEVESANTTSRVNGRAAMMGDTNPSFDIAVLTDPLDLGVLNVFLPNSAPRVRGLASGSVELSGPLAAMNTGIDLAIRGGGSISLDGSMNFSGEDPMYSLTAWAERLNLAVVLPDMKPTSINAVARATGQGTDPGRMAASLFLALRKSTFADFEIDTAVSSGNVSSGSLRLDSLYATTSGAIARGNGTFGITDSTSGTLDVTVTVDSLQSLRRWIPGDSTQILPRPARIAEAFRVARADSARVAKATEVQRAIYGGAPPTLNVKLPPALRADSIAGKAQFDGKLTGNVSRLSLDGLLQASGIVASGVSVDSARATVQATVLPGDSLHAQGELHLARATAAGFAFDSASARGNFGRSGGDLDVRLRNGVSELYTARVDARFGRDSTIVGLKEAVLAFDSSNVWRTRHPSQLLIAGDVFSIDSLAFDIGNRGYLNVSGRLAPGANDTLRIDAFGVEVGQLLALTQSDLMMTGQLSTGVTFTGGLGNPSFRGAAGFVNGTLSGKPVPELHSKFNYTGGMLSADLLASRNVGETFATGTARIPLPLGRDPIPGIRDSAMTASFTLNNVPLELVPDVTANLSMLRGRLNGEVNIAGTLNAPLVNGDVTIADGGARINTVGVQLDAINAHLVLDGKKLVIDTFTARSGGPIVLTGALGLEKLSEPSFDSLKLSARQVYVMNNEHGRLRTDTIALTMDGPFTAAKIAGSGGTLNGVIYIPDYTTKTILAPWDSLYLMVLDTTQTNARDLYFTRNAFLDNLLVTIQLNVGRDTWVRSADANIEVFSDGPLFVLMQRAGRSLTMEGVLSTERGQYTYMTKRFEVRRGSATFLPSSATNPEINPTLQIVGEHEVQLPATGEVNISVIIRGTMRAPRVSLESDAQPPLSQTDMLSYLAFGRSSGSLLTGASGLAPSGNGLQVVGKVAGQSLAGFAVGAILNEFERQAEGAGMRSLGLDQLNITPAETYTEIAKGGLLSFLRQTDFEAGRYVNRRTFVAGQLRLSATPGIRAVHRTPRGYRFETAWEPRIVLREPTLREQRSVTRRGFSLFMWREWRF